MEGKWYANFCLLAVATLLGPFNAYSDLLCKIQLSSISGSVNRKAVVSFTEKVKGFTDQKMQLTNGSIDSFVATNKKRKPNQNARSQSIASRFEAIIRPTAFNVKVTVRVPNSVVQGAASRSDNSRCEASFTATLPTATPTAVVVPPAPPPPAVASPTPTNPIIAPSHSATPIATATQPPSTPTTTPTTAPSATPSRTPSYTPTQLPTSSATTQPTATPTSSSSTCSSSAEVTTVSLPVFPNAEGHGRFTVGGSGRHLASPCTTIYRVTTLKDSGTGSLRACIEANGPRTCVFDISGPIWATKELAIKNPYLTIAGQTAPAPGIMIRGSGVSVETSNVLIQHIQVRVGDDPRESCCASQTCSPAAAQFCTADPGSRDGMRIFSKISAVNNVVIDHVSIAWALDEGLSIVPDKGDVSNVTFSNSIITSGLDMSIHPEASTVTDPGHSKGVLISGKSRVNNLSFVKNLLAHNADRNIRISSPITMEYVNNVIYDWGRGKGAGRTLELTNSVLATHQLDLISNLYLPGPDTFCPGTQYRPELCVGQNDTADKQLKIHYMLRVGGGVSSGLSALSRYYLSDNQSNTRPNAAMNEWAIADQSLFSSPAAYTLIYASNRANFPVASSYSVNTAPVASVLTEVLTHVGSRSAARDPVDQATISDVTNRKGRIINCVQADGSARCEKNAGGWPAYEVREIPFEVPSDPNGDSDNDGYTNLEEALFAASARVEE